MFRSLSSHPTLFGAFSALIAVICFSINDMAIKFLSGDYALHQVVLIRSVIGIVVIFVILMPLSPGPRILRTNRLGMHLLRGGCVVFANLTFFMGLAVLPLAEGVAIFFISPVIITVFSVIFLREQVGPLRWMAVVIGLVGVLIVLRPGTEVFQLAALLPVASAVGYAALHMLTRYIGRTESALTMSFYIQITFIFISGGIGIFVGDGRFAGGDNASLEFFFRAWTMPDSRDWWILLLIGVASGFGGFFISQAYRVAEAAIVAPVEYLAMPMAVLWGFWVFSEVPDLVAVSGIILIAGSGLFMVWREAASRSVEVPDTPRYRR